MKNVVIGVAISVDRAHTSVAAAGVLDGVNVFTLLDYLAGSDTATQIAAFNNERSAKSVVVDPHSATATLIAPLKALNVRVVEATARDLALAHGSFLDSVRGGTLKLLESHPALDAAVQHAAVRQLAGADALERRKVEADASPLEAAELAVWGLLSAPPPSWLFA